jgi:transglutaminase-like putative cysteine protease
MILTEPVTAGYLAADEAINHDHPLVRETAARLREAAADDVAFARAAFEHVRDTIPHSMDVDDRRVTWRASDVLREGTGICYAKSHALVALWRAQGIPAGLCYQRLAADDDGASHVVHGLTAVFVEGRWARLDPRGNKPGVDAQFSLDEERLAFPVRPQLGEVDYPTLYAQPHPKVLAALRGNDDCRVMCATSLPEAL